MESLLCKDKEDAKNAIDILGSQYIEDWEFLENGKVRLILVDGWKGAEI